MYRHALVWIEGRGPYPVFWLIFAIILVVVGAFGLKTIARDIQFRRLNHHLNGRRKWGASDAARSSETMDR